MEDVARCPKCGKELGRCSRYIFFCCNCDMEVHIIRGEAVMYQADYNGILRRVV